jgi:multidrug resistance efflux pump
VTTKQPKFRTDLDTAPRVIDEEHLRYFITDSKTEEVFEFGEEEYFLCTHLDGNHSATEVCRIFEKQFGWLLKPAQMEAFVAKLKNLGLLAEEPLAPWEIRYPARKGWTIATPDSLAKKMAQTFSWCFSKTFVIGVGILLTIALVWLAMHFQLFLYEMQVTQNTFSALIILLIPLFGLVIIFPLSELSKAITCKYYGGYVPTFRIRLFHRIIPNFYADIWDSLWFLSKKKRVHILSTGFVMQALLLYAGIIGWYFTEPWSIPHTCFIYFILAAAFFGIINLIPLARRDGYFLLCNHLEIDNFADRAEELFLSVLFVEPQPEALSAKDKRTFFWFGGLSLLFQIAIPTIFLGFIGYSLISALNGAGATLFLVILMLRFEETIKRQWIQIPIMGKILTCQHGVIKMRFLVKTGLLIAVAVMLFLPYPFEAGGDFKVLPAGQLGVRAEVAATIKDILVAENQVVNKGQPIAKLDERLYQNRIDILQASIAEAQAMLSLRQKGAKPEEIAKGQQAVEAARKNLQYSQKEEQRYAGMLKEKAIPETDYQLVKRKKDLDQEALELALKDLDLVKSGARDEEIKALEAELHKYEAELLQAKGDLERTTLYSPIDGVIITPYLAQRIGQRLESGDLLLVIEDNTKVVAEIEVAEESITKVKIGAEVKLRTWANPTRTLTGKTIEIAPVAYEKSLHRVERTLSNREQLLGQKEVLKPAGKVVRVLSEFPKNGDAIKTDMTGYAKIETEFLPVGIAFTRWLVRFVYVEVWSWIP